jgi:hypothetical protein
VEPPKGIFDGLDLKKEDFSVRKFSEFDHDARFFCPPTSLEDWLRENESKLANGLLTSQF